MIQNVLKYLTRGNTYFGVEISVHGTEYKYTTIGLEKSKKKLNLNYQKIEVDVKKLAKAIGKTKPVFAVINTSDVLTKQIKSVTKDDTALVNEAYPNLKIDDFHYQIYKQHDTAFVSICRKDIVNGLLKTLQEENICVIDFALGVLTVSNLIGFLGGKNEILTSDYRIELQNQQIKSLEKYSNNEPVDYDINGLDISSEHILGFSGALSLALENNTLSNNYHDERCELVEEFKNQRIYKLSIGYALGLLFTILLINFFFFNHYYYEVNELREVSQLMSNSNEKVAELSAKVMKSKKMILDVQNTADSKSSFYINTILQILPSTINLEELNFQPLKKRVEATKPIINRRGELVISGSSIDANEYSTWLTQLEVLEWVTKVDIISYESVSKSESEFSIKIQIDEEV